MRSEHADFRCRRQGDPELSVPWRDFVPVHPAANILPPIIDLVALAEDINEHGQLMPVVLFQDSVGNISLLHGRSRLDAMAMIGKPTFKDCALNPDVVDIITLQALQCYIDPYAYVMSANVHRRHLKDEDKRRVIADFLKARPDQSNRQVAVQVGVDHKTVAAVRAKCEAGGEIPHLEQRVGADGKKYPALAKNAASKITGIEVGNLDETQPSDNSEIGGEIEQIGKAERIAPARSRAARCEADKIADDYLCLVHEFHEDAKLTLGWIERMLNAQKLARRLLKQRSFLSEDQIKTIDAIAGVKLETAKKILSQASKE